MLLAAACDRGAGAKPVRKADLPPVDLQPVPAQVATACDTVEVAMQSTFGPTHRVDGAYTDSFGGTRRLGCRLTARLAASLDNNDLDRHARFESLLETRRWAQDLRFSADGPDGSDIGMRERDVLCLVMMRGNGDDDTDTTSVRTVATDSTDVIVECARDVSSNTESGVPDSLWRIAREQGLDSVYAIDFRVQFPPYLDGDFDGDGVADAAVLVARRSTGKLGVAFVLRGRGRVVLVGAGTSLEGASDDFSGVTRWDSFRKGSMRNLAIPDVPGEPLTADAVWLSRRDSTSGFVVWTGTGYRWEASSRGGR